MQIETKKDSVMRFKCTIKVPTFEDYVYITDDNQTQWTLQRLQNIAAGT